MRGLQSKFILLIDGTLGAVSEQSTAALPISSSIPEWNKYVYGLKIFFFLKKVKILLFLTESFLLLTVAAHSDIPLYIGIAVAVVVFLAGAAVVYKLLQRKTRDHSLYTMTRTGKCFIRNCLSTFSTSIE